MRTLPTITSALDANCDPGLFCVLDRYLDALRAGAHAMAVA